MTNERRQEIAERVLGVYMHVTEGFCIEPNTVCIDPNTGDIFDPSKNVDEDYLYLEAAKESSFRNQEPWLRCYGDLMNNRNGTRISSVLNYEIGDYEQAWDLFLERYPDWSW